MNLRSARPEDMPVIDEIALRFDLDSNDTSFEQFIVAEESGKLAGFGRLIQREGALELGTIGVIEEFRDKGIATTIINELIEKAGDQTLYITTLIPGFFEKFGFKRLETPPPQSMIRKKEWCEGCKQVGCTLMKRMPI